MSEHDNTLTPEPAPCEPKELARLVQSGDGQALDRITRCYGDRLLAVGRRYCGDVELARDAVQDALLSAGEHLADFRGDGSLEGWLVRMVTNFCHRMHRGRKNDPAWNQPMERAASTPTREASPEDRAALGEMMGYLSQALAEIDPKDRALIILSDAEEWKAPEIAEALGMTPGAVRTRLSRARRTLRARLGPLRDLISD